MVQRACLCRSDMCTAYLIDDDIVVCCSAGSSHINIFSVSVASPFHPKPTSIIICHIRHSILIFIQHVYTTIIISKSALKIRSLLFARVYYWITKLQFTYYGISTLYNTHYQLVTIKHQFPFDCVFRE